MYTVGPEQLPKEDASREACELMAEIFNESRLVKCTAQVLLDTDVVDKYAVRIYGGTVLGLIAEPPSFLLEVDYAQAQVGKCVCAYSDTDPVEDFDLWMAEAALADELEEFAGAATVEPHFIDLPDEIGLVITVPFDRLAWHGASGIMKDFSG